MPAVEVSAFRPDTTEVNGILFWCSKSLKNTSENPTRPYRDSIPETQDDPETSFRSLFFR